MARRVAAGRQGESGPETKNNGEREQGLAANPKADTRRAGVAGSTAGSAIGGADGTRVHEESGGATEGQR